MAEFIRSAAVAWPPDLLKRFVSAPLRANLRFGDAEILVQTNDSSILNALRECDGHSSVSHQHLVWTFVRDNSEAPLLQPAIIHHGQVTFVSMGPACLIAIDHETRELFGFLGMVVDDATFRRSVVPILRELIPRSLRSK